MTVEWHGYPQHPDAHPERPWWRWVPRTKNKYSLPRWRRVGCGALMESTDHARLMGDRVTEPPDIEKLAAYDAEHPLPAPPPKCGQVWRWLDADGVPRDASMLTDIEYTEALFASGLRCEGNDPRHWPPPGAVLVAGPGSPWSPQ